MSDLAEAPSALKSLERVLGRGISAGRDVWFGLPVDVDESSTEDVVDVRAVDADATRDLLDELRRRGFKATYHKATGRVVVEDGSRRRRR